MEITKFILENMLILVGVLYVLGMFLKATPKVPDWLIIWILLPVGIIAAIVYAGFGLDQGFTPQAVTINVVQGVLITGVAVLINQLIKQTKNRESESNSDQSAEDEEDPEIQ